MTRRPLSDRRCKQMAFGASCVLYLAVGYWLQCATASSWVTRCREFRPPESVLFSRDPHLAAIGFIFTPLTAMVEIPAISAGLRCGLT